MSFRNRNATAPPKFMNTDVNAGTVKNLLNTINTMSRQCKIQSDTDNVLERVRSIIFLHRPNLRHRTDLHVTELIMEALSPKQDDQPHQITHNYNYKYDYNTNFAPGVNNVPPPLPTVDPFGAIVPPAPQHPQNQAPYQQFPNVIIANGQPVPATNALPVQNLYINPLNNSVDRNTTTTPLPATVTSQNAAPSTVPVNTLTVQQQQDANDYEEQVRMDVDQRFGSDRQPPPPPPPPTAGAVSVYFTDSESITLNNVLDETRQNRTIVSYKNLIVLVKRTVSKYIKSGVYMRAMDEIQRFDTLAVNDVQSVVNCINRHGNINLTNDTKLCPTLVTLIAGYTQVVKVVRKQEDFNLLNYSTETELAALNVTILQNITEILALNKNYAQQKNQLQKQYDEVLELSQQSANNKSLIVSLTAFFQANDDQYDNTLTLMENLQRLLTKYNSYRQQVNTLNVQVQHLNRDQAATSLATSLSVTSQNEIITLQADKKRLTQELELATNSIERLNSQLELLRPLVQSGNTYEYFKLPQAAVDAFASINTQLRDKNEQLNLTESRLNNVKSELTLLQSQIEQLNRDNRNLKNELSNRDNTIEQLQMSIDRMRETHQNEINSIRQSKDWQIETELKRKLDTLQSQNDSFTADNNRLRRENRELVANSESIRAQFAQIQDENVDLVNEITSQRDKCQKLEILYEQLQSESASANAQTAMIAEDNNGLVTTSTVTNVDETVFGRYEEQLQSDIAQVKQSLENIISDSSDVGADFIALSNRINSKKLQEYENLEQKYLRLKQITSPENVQSIIDSTKQELNAQMSNLKSDLETIEQTQETNKSLLSQYKESFENLARSNASIEPKKREYKTDVFERTSKYLKNR
ncbi:desmoplakin [Sucra jujuba nucleopolyhedrovirus]|uniref:Desmoplakin n=1 Tax=Sucra jujuba nucleopolyhedrovirus TaxID=1563660 RepID=A0A097P8Z5_9ABAC|nr:desmoplakin [Sucra jujuba nucleopolyhedrovirus]AIU41301.1 desmoplakin [Sucra jujuba nucleopolyhedrovirus]